MGGWGRDFGLVDSYTFRGTDDFRNQKPTLRSIPTFPLRVGRLPLPTPRPNRTPDQVQDVSDSVPPGSRPKDWRRGSVSIWVPTAPGPFETMPTGSSRTGREHHSRPEGVQTDLGPSGVRGT